MATNINITDLLQLAQPKGFTGSQGIQGPAGLKTWTVINQNYQAEDGDRIIADTSVSPFSITLPLNPDPGTYIQITDGADFLTNNLTVISTDRTIENQSVDVLINMSNVTVEFVYGTDTWQVTSTGGPRGFTGSQGFTGSFGFTGSQGDIGFTGSQGAGFTGSAGVNTIPQITASSARTLNIDDVGKHISITSGGITIPSGVFSVGDAVSIFNNSSNSQTISSSGVTTFFAGTSATGTRTLAQRGICTILCVASNTFVIFGAGLI
jgi:hypothetical protein